MSEATLELDPEEFLIFFRKEGFYPIQAVKGMGLKEQAKLHAELNPGTLRVEDKTGYALWWLQ